MRCLDGRDGGATQRCGKFIDRRNEGIELVIDIDIDMDTSGPRSVDDLRRRSTPSQPSQARNLSQIPRHVCTRKGT